MPPTVSQAIDARLQRFLGFLQVDPGNVPLQIDIFDMALAQGAFEIAQQRIEYAADVMPDDPQWAHRLALLLRSMHRSSAIEDAMTLFESRMTQPIATDAVFGIASLIAVDAGRLDDATAWAERALKTQPVQLEALVARGTCALAEQDADTAIIYLQRALETHAQDGRTWSALGIACMLRMQLAQALQHFEKAVAYMPEHIGTWHAMAWCHLLSKDIAAAQAAFEHALALDRNFGESHGGLGVVLAMQGCAGEAQEHIERALRLDPQNVSARYAQAVLSGEADHADRFGKLAGRILGGHAIGGKSIAEIVSKRLR